MYCLIAFIFSRSSKGYNHIKLLKENLILGVKRLKTETTAECIVLQKNNNKNPDPRIFLEL